MQEFLSDFAYSIFNVFAFLSLLSLAFGLLGIVGSMLYMSYEAVKDFFVKDKNFKHTDDRVFLGRDGLAWSGLILALLTVGMVGTGISVAIAATILN